MPLVGKLHVGRVISNALFHQLLVLFPRRLQIYAHAVQPRRRGQQMLSNRLETLAIYICRGSIPRIEDKQRTVTDIELYGLAKVLGVSIEELFRE